jgi:hypothetical protein
MVKSVTPAATALVGTSAAKASTAAVITVNARRFIALPPIARTNWTPDIAPVVVPMVVNRMVTQRQVLH